MDSYCSISHFKLNYILPFALTAISFPFLSKQHVLKIRLLSTVVAMFYLPLAVLMIGPPEKTCVFEAGTDPKHANTLAGGFLLIVSSSYMTCLLYVLAHTAVFNHTCLIHQGDPPKWMKITKYVGHGLLVMMMRWGTRVMRLGDTDFVLGTVIITISLGAFLFWSLAGYFILSLPYHATVLPIAASTLFQLVGTGIETRGILWILVILLTNILVVFGLATVDQYLAVIDLHPSLITAPSASPRCLSILRASLMGTELLNLEMIKSLQDANDLLRLKSRSFYFASFAFRGRLRIDLIFLYSFCRCADDLIDEAESTKSMLSWILKLQRYLDHFYYKSNKCSYMLRPEINRAQVNLFIESEFPAPAWPCLKFLPIHILPGAPLYAILRGFRMDLEFKIAEGDYDLGFSFPIKDENALMDYTYCVAGTIGELCMALVFYHAQATAHKPPKSFQRKEMSRQLETAVMEAAVRMGQALQLVNIARDIATDAAIGRVYLPETWLAEFGLTCTDVLKNPRGTVMHTLRGRLLERAFDIYNRTRASMNMIPDDARVPMILAVESYMEIGRVLRGASMETVDKGEVSLPSSRRLWLAFRVWRENK
ncbi:hypothetical protein VTK73DRAFT_2750 [Phialemonium thermophilum]|uniref:15-cis-phytoene synthase n=1 Tax=Phialemonium thermophilum TaxID=223376 RepID=A0ABR3Y165_9PEZI